MGRLKIGVLASGSGSNFQNIIEYFSKNKPNFEYEISILISNKKNAYALKRADDFGIDNIYFSKSDFKDGFNRDKEILKELKKRNVNLVVLAGYLAKIPDFIIEEYENKILNIHPSLIPSFSGKGYYGEKVHKAVFERGVKLSGATTHFVNNGLDEGPIILQKAVCLSGTNSPEDIQKKVLKVEHEILPKTIDLIGNDMVKVIENKVIISSNSKGVI